MFCGLPWQPTSIVLEKNDGYNQTISRYGSVRYHVGIVVQGLRVIFLVVQSFMLRSRLGYICLLTVLATMSAVLSYRVGANEDELGETPPEQKAAMDALTGIASNIQTNRDGTVRFARFSKAKVSDEHLDQIKVFKQIDYLAIVTDTVTEKGLANIQDLVNLDSLILTNVPLTDEKISLLSRLVKLDTLYLDSTRVTSSSLETISRLKLLKTLSLADTAVSDKHLEHLAELESLECLILDDTQVTGQAVPKLAKNKSLKSLSLNGTRLQGTSLAILSECAQLEMLDLSRTDVTADQLSDLQESKSLRQVILLGTPVQREQLVALAKMMPQTRFTLEPAGTREESLFARLLAGKPLQAAPKGPAIAPVNLDVEPSPSVKQRFADSVEEVPDFQRHVVPLLGRLGCNGRSCHGSFQGKGGFTLSMFGYDFSADHKQLLDEERGRVITDDVDSSLVLLKPTGVEEHGGGVRFKQGGWEHRLLKKWIAAGAAGKPKVNRVVGFQVTPAEILFASSDEQAQLSAIVTWDDGSREDVTPLARFQTKDDAIAVVNADGLVTAKSAGATHIIVTYDKAVQDIPVIRPLSNLVGDHFPKVPTPTRVDELVVDRLAKLGIVPADTCTDEEFLRRVMLDIAGTLPTPDQVEKFVADRSAGKRLKRINELLETPAYYNWWAMKLTDLTGCNGERLGSTDMNSHAAQQWEAWIRQRLVDNTSWDKIAAGIILAESREPGQSYEGFTWQHSELMREPGYPGFSDEDRSMHYYWARSDLNQPLEKALSFGYVFLGVRLQCAQCHKHPFDQWSKQDFDDFANVFSRIRWGVGPEMNHRYEQLRQRLGVPEKLNTAALRRQMYQRVSREGLPIPWREIYIDPPTKEPNMGRLLGGQSFDLNAFADPREPLVQWLLSEDNPYFARAFVNRVWHHYFGVGIVDPVDDFNSGNPPSNQPLLDWLADEFVRQGYDLKWLHRTITGSRTYQLSWQTNDTNKNDDRNFSHYRIRRLPAEVIIDGIRQATADTDGNRSYLEEVEKRDIRRHPRSLSPRAIGYALSIFGKPTRSTNCDCERKTAPTLLQALFTRNDREMLEQIERPDGWLAEIAGQLGEELVSEMTGEVVVKAATESPTKRPEKLTDDQLVNAVYYRTLGRSPSDAERKRSREHLLSAISTTEGLRELLWALLNTREFQTNH